MMARLGGVRSSSSASFVLMTINPSNRNEGRSDGRPPVAIMASVNEKSSSPPALRICSVFGPVKDARPETTSTPFPLQSCAMASGTGAEDDAVDLAGHEATERLRALIPFRHGVPPPLLAHEILMRSERFRAPRCEERLAGMSESVGWVGGGLAGKVLFHGLLLTTAAGLFLAGSWVFPSVVHPMCIEGGAYSG